MRYLINDYKRELLKNKKEEVINNDTINNEIKDNNNVIQNNNLVQNNCDYLIPIDIKNHMSKK